MTTDKDGHEIVVGCYVDYMLPTGRRGTARVHTLADDGYGGVAIHLREQEDDQPAGLLTGATEFTATPGDLAVIALPDTAGGLQCALQEAEIWARKTGAHALYAKRRADEAEARVADLRTRVAVAWTEKSAAPR